MPGGPEPRLPFLDMAIYPIRTFGDPVLRQTAEPLEEFDEALERLIEDLLETMYDAPGVGLAAPQIGISRRVFVYDIGEGPGHLVNPELLETSGEWEFEEGCLSVPGRFWSIKRPGLARARGFDLNGNPVELAGDELMGRMLQHEIDHLGGTLLLTHLPRDLKKEALRELREEALGIRAPE